jgi:hypothetical protein
MTTAKKSFETNSQTPVVMFRMAIQDTARKHISFNVEASNKGFKCYPTCSRRPPSHYERVDQEQEIVTIEEALKDDMLCELCQKTLIKAIAKGKVQEFDIEVLAAEAAAAKAAEIIVFYYDVMNDFKSGKGYAMYTYTTEDGVTHESYGVSKLPDVINRKRGYRVVYPKNHKKSLPEDEQLIANYFARKEAERKAADEAKMAAFKAAHPEYYQD